jgi:hypothetical protein
MSQNIECTECHDLVTLEGGRVITVPFICRVCVASSEAKPLQARPGLVIQECDNIACDCHAQNQPAASSYEPSAEGEPTDMMPKLLKAITNPEVQSAFPDQAKAITDEALATQGQVIDFEGVLEVIRDTAADDANVIITDLQQQLSQLAEYVADIEVQLQNARSEAQMSSIQNLSLKSDNEFINQQNTEVNKQLSAVRRDLKAALVIAARLA